MKATITHNGTLQIAAETDLEAYALKRWLDLHSDELAACPGIAFDFLSEAQRAAAQVAHDANRQRLM